MIARGNPLSVTLLAIFGRRHVIGRWLFFLAVSAQKKSIPSIELDPREETCSSKAREYIILRARNSLREGRAVTLPFRFIVLPEKNHSLSLSLFTTFKRKSLIVRKAKASHVESHLSSMMRVF